MQQHEIDLQQREINAKLERMHERAARASAIREQIGTTIAHSRVLAQEAS